MSKFDRNNFFKSYKINDKLEYDLLDNNFNLFKITRPMKRMTIDRSTTARPDRLSIFAYGVMHYWWILLKFNKIDDVWNDMNVSDQIDIPDILDIEDFYIAVRQKLQEQN